MKILTPDGRTDGHLTGSTSRLGRELIKSTNVCLPGAALEPFPTVRHPRIHQPVVGTPLTLRCRPPRSYPKATIFWGVENVGLQQIETDDRVTLDYNGNYLRYE